jgi:hypothetical protein
LYRNKVLAVVAALLLYFASFYNLSFADTDSVTVSNPLLEDANGNIANSLNPGQRASIFVSIENNEAAQQVFTVVFELQDIDGVTFNLQWQSGVRAE